MFNSISGLAFGIGGDKSLDEHVTLASELTHSSEAYFAPFQTFFVSSTPISSDIRPVLDLRMFGRCGMSGAVSQTSPATFQTAKLNAAIPGAESSDLVGQANDLIRRMKEHPEVEFI